ncbi:retrotransposon gag family protein, partial [Aciditerrimonas ferrireducens]
MIDRFMRQLPPVFKGSPDPIKAEEWLASLDKIFDVLQCDNLEKTRLAVYRLVGEANQWWEEIKGRKTQDEIQTMNWEAFKEVFLRKYFPLTERVRMETQFLELRQKEGDSLADYEAKFVQLSRYDPHLIINPQSKMERFKHGLKPVIRRA